MRVVVAVIVSAGIAAGITYAVVYSKNSKTLAAWESRQAVWQQEKNDVVESLQHARGRQPQSRTVYSTNTVETPVLGSLPPEEIIARLKTMRATSRDKSIRPVIHHLEMLADIGPAAIPAIKAYLEEYQDIDYLARPENNEGENREGGERRERGPGGDRGERGERGDRGGEGRGPGGDPRERFRAMFNRGEVRLSFSTPPSLRIGLVDVLAKIGGPEAEEVLGNMVSESGRAMEVAYVSKTLKELTGDKYRDAAVTSAKDLLINPLQPQAGDRLDRDSKDYCYYVLALFNDASFIPAAQQMLITANGRLDTDALSYLHKTLQVNAMPAIATAFNDPRITNQMDKAPLVQMALNYVGQNQQANEMLNAVVSNDQVPSEMRAMTVMSLVRDEAPKETLEARLPVIEALKGGTQDERVQRSLSLAQKAVEWKISGQPLDDGMLRNWYREGQGQGQGGRGNGGPRGGGGGGGRGQRGQ